MLEPAKLSGEIKSCQKCSLRYKCKSPIPGIQGGKGRVKLFFVGEQPNKEDDKEGVPFRGRKGDLLKEFLREAEIALNQCYFTYMVKCYSYKEIEQENINKCRGWVWKEILDKLVEPGIIITLGLLPASILLKKKRGEPMKSWVGRPHNVEWVDSPIYPWYSPYHLLNNTFLYWQSKKFFKQLKELSDAVA